MQKSIWILLLLLLVSCEKDCNEDIGVIQQKEFIVAAFDEIIVNSGVELIIKESVTQQVIVEAGENRFDNISISVSNKVLELQAESSCALNPSLDAVTVYVQCPDLKSIRNSSEYMVSSDGILTYPILKLISENYESDYLNFGDFDLKVNNDKITVLSNGLSVFKVSGSTNTLGLYYYASIGKFEGKELVAEHVTIYHRADNSLKVNPQQSLEGGIYATGNLISYNRPPVVDVTEYFMGELIFE